MTIQAAASRLSRKLDRLTDVDEVSERAAENEWTEDANQEVVDEVSYGSFQDVAKSMDDESVELIFADPPWDSASVGLYEDLAAIAGRVLIPGGASGSPFPAAPRKAPIAS